MGAIKRVQREVDKTSQVSRVATSELCKWPNCARRRPLGAMSSSEKSCSRLTGHAIRVTRKQLTVSVQFHGRWVWREYFAPDRRAASRLTVDAIAADGGAHPLTAELLLSIWLMMTSLSFALRGRPGSSSMMDSPTPSTVHPSGHRCSRWCLHPLHLRLQRNKQNSHKFVALSAGED